MASWRNSPSKGISLKQKILCAKEFNFSNQFLWRLPGIDNKFKAGSPIFSPIKLGVLPIRLKKFYSVSTVRSIETKEKKISQEPKKAHKIQPQFQINGTPKVREKQYFRKTFMGKILLPKNLLPNQRKKSVSEDYNINGWGEGEKSKILLHNLTIL